MLVTLEVDPSTLIAQGLSAALLLAAFLAVLQSGGKN